MGWDAVGCTGVVRCRKTFQCQNRRVQTSLIAGTLFQGTSLTPTLWFLAIFWQGVSPVPLGYW